MRANALKKLAQVSLDKGCLLEKITSSLPVSYSSNTSKLYTIPLTLNELEILVSLCNTRPKSLLQAETLLNIISLYFLESHKQKYTDILLERFKIDGLRHPNELVTLELTKFLIRLFEDFSELRDRITQLINNYLDVFSGQLEVKFLLSLAGFIGAFIDKTGETLSSLHFSIHDKMQLLISPEFLSRIDITVEQASATEILVQYSNSGRDLCAFLFSDLMETFQITLVSCLFNIRNDTKLSEFLLYLRELEYSDVESDEIDQFKSKIKEKKNILTKICDYSLNQINEIEHSSKSINLQSENTILMASSTKQKALEILSLGLFLENSIYIETLITVVSSELEWFALANQSVRSEWLEIIIIIASLVSFFSDNISSQLLHAFQIMVSSAYTSTEIVCKISKHFSKGLKSMNEDAVVGTIYSLNNLLIVTEHGTVMQVLKETRPTTLGPDNMSLLSSKRETSETPLIYQSLNRRSQSNGSFYSNNEGNIPPSMPTSVSQHLPFESDATYHDKLLKNSVSASIGIASHYNNQSITALAITMLTQKFGIVSNKLDDIILMALADLSIYLNENIFASLNRFFKSILANAIEKNDKFILNSIHNSSMKISKYLKAKSDTLLFNIYLRELLLNIIARGDVEKLEHHRSHTEISKVAEQIAIYLKPLAALLPSPCETPIDLSNDESTTNMFRNIWFNMVIHGFHENSELTKKHFEELKIIAHNSPPLACDFPVNNKETSLEMNTILRRGSSNHNLKEQKHAISNYLSNNAMVSRTYSTPKIMFLASAVFLEGLRCKSGDCSKVILYFSDPSIVKSNIDKVIGLLTVDIICGYIKETVRGDPRIFSADQVAEQLTHILLLLTHRDSYLQDYAFQSCDLFIKKIPSSLCHPNSLYTLLDSLTMLFDSVIDCETNKYAPRYTYILKHSGKNVLLSDSYQWRCNTLERLQKHAEQWVKEILKKANQDMKILLQSYISDLGGFHRLNSVEFGVSFALEMAGAILPVDREISKISYKNHSRPDSVSGFLSQHSWRSKFLIDRSTISSYREFQKERMACKTHILELLKEGMPISHKDTTNFLDLSATLLILNKKESASLVYDMVSIPFQIFTSDSMKSATNVWLSIIKERKDLSHLLISEICSFWCHSIDDNCGLYSRKYDLVCEDFQIMEYSPYDKEHINYLAREASKSIQPHLHVIRFFSSHFEGTLFKSTHLLKIFTTISLYGVSHLLKASLHPFSRISRTELLNFAMLTLYINVKHQTWDVKNLCCEIINGALSWFMHPVSWPFGSNILKIKADLSVLKEFHVHLKQQSDILNRYCGDRCTLVEYFLMSEIHTLETWLNPLLKASDLPKLSPGAIRMAFNISPGLAVMLVNRYHSKTHGNELATLVQSHPLSFVSIPDALKYWMNIENHKTAHYTLYWTLIAPLKAINLFLPTFKKNGFLLQYTLRTLKSHDVNLTFFYVPQLVQCLRYDVDGYVEKFILETAEISNLFSHQIIWNMLANGYKDDESLIEDEIKPILDRVREKMILSFSKENLEFYQREFQFFDDITSISGKLKPYIKKTKAKKKSKIDEEMAKIVVQHGVYLPSNPDGTVIDIDRKSGKPLQSHAKAPFMASFKITKQVTNDSTGEKEVVEKWQSAIFKVGDDCRQDVLSLQLISIFRSIWSTIGLDIYVFPYRVTATAPGCGVIDVLPNSISRDMLGREAVNGLYEYFITKFGQETTIEFQRARNNFVKSLAAYSVISYLLQFKDRHNGNIMYDDQGHCLHIDFGFIFDLVPGGVKFEAVPFKLTKEMVRVMGGNQDTQAYKEFEELCIKAYLAARPHLSFIVGCVTPMLGSGLPCFKGMKTIKNLESRFQPGKSAQEAAQYMRTLIRKSYESIFTKGYDEFQRLTNGIPY